jgi:hypothetical protein
VRLQGSNQRVHYLRWHGVFSHALRVSRRSNCITAVATRSGHAAIRAPTVAHHLADQCRASGHAR